jgi:hypothetical protein
MNRITLDDNHIYRLDGAIIPGFSEIAREMGLSDYSHVSQAVMDAACQFGHAVHSACELHDKGVLDEDSLSLPLVAYLNGWRNFSRDYNVLVVPDWIEAVTGSARWRFGCKPDRVVVIRDKVVVVEIKSTTSIMPAVSLQTAAQKIAVEENYGKVHRRMAVRLTGEDDGCGYCVHEFKNQKDEETFICARKLYAWKKENL